MAKPLKFAHGPAGVGRRADDRSDRAARAASAMSRLNASDEPEARMQQFRLSVLIQIFVAGGAPQRRDRERRLVHDRAAHGIHRHRPDFQRIVLVDVQRSRARRFGEVVVPNGTGGARGKPQRVAPAPASHVSRLVVFAMA